MTPKIVDGTVTIDGQLYKAFEMFGGGPWKIVKGHRYDGDVVAKNLKVKTGRKALVLWLATLAAKD